MLQLAAVLFLLFLVGVLTALFRKKKRKPGNAKVIDALALNNALRKLEGKPPLRIIQGDKKG